MATAFVALVVLPGCSPRGGDPPTDSEEEAVDPIEQVLARYTEEWMAVPGVVATGIGLCDERPCIKVFVARRTPEVTSRIPETAQGHPVRIEVSGEFRAYDSTESREP